MDQYASKVIEKCLKIGGVDFLDRYLDRVCEGRADRPRMPLIDSKFSKLRLTLTIANNEQSPVTSLATISFSTSWDMLALSTAR